MKYFLQRLSLFAILVVAALTVLTAFTDVRLRNRDEGRMKVWHRIEQGGVNADVLIIGNSHAHVQVDPRRLQVAFPSKRIYNLGLEGYTFDMQLARYKFYLHHNKAPRAILFCADYFQFYRSKWEVDKPQFLPYVYDSAVGNALHSIGFSGAKLIVHFLKYRGEANSLLAAFTGSSPLPDDAHDRKGWDGFEPMNEHWNEKAFVADTLRSHHQPQVDSVVWHAFQCFLRDCRKTSTFVYVVFTPHQARFTAQMTDAVGYRTWLHKAVRPVPFIDFSGVPFCADTALFYNGTHLNEKGADIFSASLADSLQKIFSN